MKLAGLLLLLCGVVVAPVFAMDGVCIATILNGPTFKYEAVFGPLVKYEIVKDSVGRVDTLNDMNAASPRINMSGTYYAYVRNDGGLNRSLVIKPLYGNPSRSCVIPLQKGANWLWWVENNSFFYTVNDGSGHNIIRKLALSRVSGQLVVDDRMWVKTQEGMQGGFVGLDLTGEKLSYKAVTPTYACLVTGDSTKPPINVDIGIIGCGNSISPSGTWWTQFPGGHAAVGWGRWDKTFFKNVWYTTMDSSWAVVQSNSPLRNLEARWALYGYPWMKSPIGIFGTENIWSQNSEDWFVSEVGMALNGDGECINAVAINIRTSKAINITQIVPVRERYMNQFNPQQLACEFRYNGEGPGFSNGVQKNADRPILWCSSKEDVWEKLWHYIENREDDNRHWAELLDLPLSQIPSSSVVAATTNSPARRSFKLRRISSGCSVEMLRLAASSASYEVLDQAGKVVAMGRVVGKNVDLPIAGKGVYAVRIYSSATTFAQFLMVK